jgi:hypothetical protein
MKETFESKSQIYGVYWRYENLLLNVWKIIKENTKLFALDVIGKSLVEEMKSHEVYQNPSIRYIPREAFLECVIKVFYNLYYPTDILRGKFKIWEGNVKSTF